MPSLTPEEAHDKAIFLLGPWLAGASLELLLQGVVYCQISHYYTWYHDDSRYLKFGVAGLALLTTLKSIQSFALVWITLIERFSDIEAATTLTWLETGNGLMVSGIGIYVQTFFCYRLYIVSGKRWIVAIIGSIMLFAFLAIVLATYFITADAYTQIGTWFAVHLSATFAGDVLLSSCMIYFLIRKKNARFRKSSNLISALIRLTLQSALPAAICATLNLIFSQLYPGTEKIISTTFNMMLPKLYAISMMYTLNARRIIRSAFDDVENTVDTLTSSAPPHPPPRVSLQAEGSKHRVPVELTELSSMGWTENLGSDLGLESLGKASGSADLHVGFALQDDVKRRG